jgi:hypothetical protein
MIINLNIAINIAIEKVCKKYVLEHHSVVSVGINIIFIYVSIVKKDFKLTLKEVF